MKDDILEQEGVMDFLNRVAGGLGRAFYRLRSGPQGVDWDDLTSRSRASNLHDYLMAELKAEFEDDDDVTYQEDNQLRTLVTSFGELRAKKANRRFSAVSHNATHRTKEWLQVPLNRDLAPLDKLFIGYSVGKEWNTLQEMALMEFHGKVVADLIIIPFEDHIPFDPVVEPTRFIAPLRLNVSGMRRERQVQLRMEEGEHDETGS